LNKSLKQIWKESAVLAQLGKRENLNGKCEKCEFRDCHGCRRLALSLTGDYLEEDPHCWYSPEILSETHRIVSPHTFLVY
jgi:radical SAM protein with 4Fe4S-binding SPASM domain